MKMLRKRFVFVSVLMMVLLCICCGCTNEKTVVDEKYIEDELQERYGMEFVCDSLNYSQHMYIGTCHSAVDPSISFECMYGENGDFGYDYYIGAIISREEEEFFTSCLNKYIKNVYTKCAYAIIVDDCTPDDSDGDLLICDMVKNGTFTIEKVYDIHPISRLSFKIFIDDSDEQLSYLDEYKIIENSVDELVRKYKELYELDIYVDMCIYFLNSSDYESVYKYFNCGNENINVDALNSNIIQIEMGIPKDYVTEDLWLSSSQYIARRREMVE